MAAECKSVSPSEARLWLRGLLADGLNALQWDGPLDDEVSDLLEAAAELAGASFSDSTLRSYGTGWSAWTVWCGTRGLCPVPAEPRHVALYAASLYAREEPRRPVTVAARLAAINTVHRLLGHPEPATTGAALAVQRGARRRYGTAPLLAKDALVMSGLRRLLASAVEHPDRLRDGAVVALHSVGLGPAVLADLDWRAVREVGDGTWDVQLSSRVVRVVRIGTTGDPAEALAQARPACAQGPVTRPVRHLAGAERPGSMSRQGVVKLLRRTAVAAGLDIPPGGVPELRQAEHQQILTHLGELTPEELRDRCVLLVGWSAALRRSSLAALDWGDVEFDPPTGEICLRLRAQKNDPEGLGHEVWLVPQPEDPELCPVRALDAWRACLQDFLKADPADLPTCPLLVRMSPARVPYVDAGGRLHRLSPDAVHGVVTRLADRAGMPVGAFGSHSLRSGWITEAAGTEGVSPLDIQQVSGHKTLESVLRYVRPVNARRRNPNRKMSRR